MDPHQKGYHQFPHGARKAAEKPATIRRQRRLNIASAARFVSSAPADAPLAAP